MHHIANINMLLGNVTPFAFAVLAVHVIVVFVVT